MHLLKFLIVFILGVGVTLWLIQFVFKAYNPGVLGDKTSMTGVGSIISVERIQDAQANFVSKFIYDKIVPSIANSPALAPLFETKRSVDESIEAVSTLPDEQKSAICRELCGLQKR